MRASGFPNGHALVVAIAAYHSNPLPSVVINDAREVVKILTSPDHCGYDTANVTSLLDGAATKSAILAALKCLADRTGPDDTVCVYFSGHGAHLGGSDGEESCLIPFDYKDLASTIRADEFSVALHAIKANKLMVFLDACHAAGAGTIKGESDALPLAYGFSEKSLSSLSEGIGRAIMASSRPSETSLIMRGASNSAFTAALLEGLVGQADHQNTGLVKLFDLFDYVSKRVPKITNDQQHPVLRTKIEQNFPLALSLGGIKGAVGGTPSQAMCPDIWTTLNEVLPTLYPSGPSDQEIWDRAGGDVSRLRLQGTGRGTWFAAIRTLEHGGGGDQITVHSLLQEVLKDFPRHPKINRLA